MFETANKERQKKRKKKEVRKNHGRIESREKK